MGFVEHSVHTNKQNLFECSRTLTCSRCASHKYALVCTYLNEQNKTAESNDQGNHDRSISEIQSGSNDRIITPITQEHITCFSDKFVKNEIKFLIDSGSEMNIIKISSLKGPVEIVGSVVFPIYINKQLFTVKFDIVYDNFPIPEAEIDNNALIIPPRSNCVLQIRADEQIEHEFITIEKYEINEDVIIANSISPVKGDKIIMAECHESALVLIALVHLLVLVFGLPYILWCVSCLYRIIAFRMNPGILFSETR
ncbi:CCHC-type domain-containing protein, partial [Aphis craccivora]